MRYISAVPRRSLAFEPDYGALARFRHLLRRFLVFSEQAAREAGIHPRQHQLLLAVKGLPPHVLPTIRELAWQLQLKHHTVVGLVDRMVALGMVRRLRHVRDHREVLIDVAPRGEAVLRRLSLAHREELRRIGPQILPALAEVFDPYEKESAPCPTPSRSSLQKRETPRARARGLATSRRPRAFSRSASSPSRSAP
jgi:DNA-binding MarR family transcriptional regulator